MGVPGTGGHAARDAAWRPGCKDRFPARTVLTACAPACEHRDLLEGDAATDSDHRGDHAQSPDLYFRRAAVRTRRHVGADLQEPGADSGTAGQASVLLLARAGGGRENL